MIERISPVIRRDRPVCLDELEAQQDALRAIVAALAPLPEEAAAGVIKHVWRQYANADKLTGVSRST
jgi:hypothetical protein